MKTIATPQKTIIFRTDQAADLQEQLDEARIIAHVLKLLRTSSEEPLGSNIHDIVCTDKKVVTFDYVPKFDELSDYLFSYEAKDYPSYKNAKVKIEALGFEIAESESEKGNRLVWTITNSKV